MNLLSSILSNLHVRHSVYFSNKIYYNHPFKNSFFGLSRMLDLYGVENASFKVNNIHQYESFDCPFLVQMGQHFALIHDFSFTEVKCEINGKIHIFSGDDFIKRSSGAVLLFETNENTKEPKYFQNVFVSILKTLACACFFVCLFYQIIFIGYNSENVRLATSLTLLFSSLGLVISIISIRKEHKISNKYVDKFCTLFRNSNCDDLITSTNGKLFGIYSWSVIGTAFFFANILCIQFYGINNTCILIVNLLTILFTMWSLYYQMRVVKRFCPLCILISVTCWGNALTLFFANSENNLTSTSFDISDLDALSLYGILFIGGFCLITLYLRQISLDILNKKNALFKFKDSTLAAMLTLYKPYDIETFATNIIVANPNGKIRLSVLTNPHCAPCSRMHARLEKLSLLNPELRIEYIFTSFTEELEDSVYCLVYNFFHSSDFTSVLHEWFETGKNDRQNFYKKYPFNKADSITFEEIQLHNKWKKYSNLAATPTILINGRLMPDDYSVEDLEYITSL